ncbi:MAG: hypothetical protein ACP5NS_01815 [Candidatus Pacearchaeota archaeon]
MFEKFLHEVVSLVAGSSADKIVEVLHGKKNVNEFLIAKKLNFTINQARNILYKLADEGLVYFNRKKDSKSGGWYTYFWTLDEEKCLVYYRDRLLKDSANIEHALNSRRTTRFYFCKTCSMEMSEEQALLQEFTCPECGTVFELKDTSSGIKDSEKQVLKLKAKVMEVGAVLDTIVAARLAESAKVEAAALKKKKTLKKKTAKAKKEAKKTVKKPLAKSRPKSRKK